MNEFGVGFADKSRSRICSAEPFRKSMKINDTQKYGIYLRKLNNEALEKLLSCLLQEMRRRDSEDMKKDVFAISKALAQTKPVSNAICLANDFRDGKSRAD